MTPVLAFGVVSEVTSLITLSAYGAAGRVLEDQTNFRVADSGLVPNYIPPNPVAQEKQ